MMLAGLRGQAKRNVLLGPFLLFCRKIYLTPIMSGEEVISVP